MQSPSFVCYSPDHERPSLGSHRAASAEGSILKAHQRRRSLGCSLLLFWPTELVRSDRGQLSFSCRWSSSSDTRGRRLRASARNARFHYVGFRGGETRTVRPESDVEGAG